MQDAIYTNGVWFSPAKFVSPGANSFIYYMLTERGRQPKERAHTVPARILQCVPLNYDDAATLRRLPTSRGAEGTQSRREHP